MLRRELPADAHDLLFVRIDLDARSRFDLSILTFFQQSQRVEEDGEGYGRSGFVIACFPARGAKSQLLSIDGRRRLDANAQLAAFAHAAALLRASNGTFDDGIFRNHDVTVYNYGLGDLESQRVAFDCCLARLGSHDLELSSFRKGDGGST